MTPEQLAEGRRLLAAGPLHEAVYSKALKLDCYRVFDPGGGPVRLMCEGDAEAASVVWAVNNVEALMDEVERFRVFCAHVNWARNE